MTAPTYVDTSALVALIVNEPHSAAVAEWYAATDAELVSAAWCVPEFASAMSIKQRTGHLSAQQARLAWERFERLTAADLVLLPVAASAYSRAASLALDPANALRAGDALHLACAEDAGARTLVTLDAAQARGARRLKIKVTEFGA